MAYSKLNIVRDCWWANPSGNKLCDETGSASTQTNGLYKSLNTSNTSYMTFLPSGAYSATAVDAYVGRLESTNIVPDIVQINVTTSGNMAGGAECILSINNSVLTPFTLTSETTYSTTTSYIDTTHPAILGGILAGRISDNYDFFKLYFNKNNNETIKVYNVEIFFSGVRTWDNYTGGLPNVLSVYAPPNNLNFRNGSTWKDHDNNLVNTNSSHIISTDLYELDNNVGARSFIRLNNEHFKLTNKLSPGSGNFWVSYWFKPDVMTYPSEADQTCTIISTDHWTNVPSGFYIGYNQIGANYLQVNFGAHLGAVKLSGNFNDILATSGVWHHAVVLFDRTDKLVTAYKNGAKSTYSLNITTASGACNPSDAYSTTIGSRWNGADGRMYGAISCLCYGSGSLPTSGEILELYNNGFGKRYSELSPPLAAKVRHYWDCHENTASGVLLDFKSSNSGIDYGGVGSTAGPHSNDLQYIRHTTPPAYSNSWSAAGVTIAPNGGLTMVFDVDGLDPLSQVTRAQLTMRMSLPTSGQYDNARDTFEINGYNARFKEQDYKDEMREAIGSVPSRNAQYGYFLYGAGSIVEQSGFKTYRTELSFLDPNLPNGDLASITYRNIDIFNTMEFKVVGLPSGTLLSAAQLYLEYLPNEHLGLYTTGGIGLIRRFVPSTVDVGGLENPLFGDGAWQHRGNLNEGAIFDAFYKFNEASGIYTHPVSFNAASGCYGEYLNRINEDIIYDGDVPTGANYTFISVEPQRRNYYRNPLRTSFGTLYDPKYYRDLIYNGLAILPFDIHNPNQSRYSPDITQVYFGNRMNIGTDFTLYFMIYREPTNEGQVFGKIFQRSLLGSQGDIKFEVLGLLGTEDITFAIKDTNDSTHRLTLPLPVYGIEPLLVWFTCKYDITTNKTTIKLAAHTDVRNYFTADWLYVEETFNFQRKQYQDVKTGIGPLYSPQDLDQELAFSSFLSFVSLCEFGWADSAIELAYNTSDDLIKDSYDISEDIDKQFFASRVCNGEYLQARAPNSDSIGGDPIATSGWKNPGFAYGGSLISYNGQEWNDAGGIQVRGGSYVATHDVLWQYGTPSLYLMGTNFNFNLPVSSVITGMEARYYGMKTGMGRVEVVDVQLLMFDYPTYTYEPIGYSQASSGPRYLPTTFYQPLTYGGPSNLWGLTTDFYQYTPEEILALVNDNSFGVGLRVGPATASPATAYIDYLEMKIYTSGIQTGTLDEFKHITWLVPVGSGAAEWSTKYKINDWNHEEYQLYNPITTAGTHNIVHPSAIYIEIETEHSTNHPSGAQIICDIELDTGSTDNWKVFRTEFNIPSGVLSSRVQGFTKHIGMNSEPVLYSDINQIGLNFTTKYVDLDGNQYYGDLGIKSVKVYFDSYSASVTGVSILPLYTSGTNPTANAEHDLFIEGYLSTNNYITPPRFDLYIFGLPHQASSVPPTLYVAGGGFPSSGTSLYTYGIPYYGSGQMPLYIYNITHQKATLFIEGLTPGSGAESVPLYTYATPAGVGGLYKITPLYLCGALPNNFVPLYLHNTVLDTGSPSYSIPLYLHAAPLPTYNIDMDLFLQAPSGEMRPGVTYLYVRGLGTTEGALSTSARAPLFMARDNESLEKSMTLYVAQAQNWQMADLYIKGGSIIPSSISLYVKGSGLFRENIRLYTHGF